MFILSVFFFVFFHRFFRFFLSLSGLWGSSFPFSFSFFLIIG